MAPSILEPEPVPVMNIPLKSKEAITAKQSPPHEEHQYLNLIREILENGEHRPDRNRHPLSLRSHPPKILPLPPRHRDAHPSPPNHKTRLPPRRHAELLWFISGSTSSIPLSSAGVKIWDGNGSRAFLESVGLSHREVGDLGPVYGFQWRHFGASYVDAKTDYEGQGVDQLPEVIHKLKHSPYDRRIILSAWNPADLKKMALPPCHMFAQFYVSYPAATKGVDSILNLENGQEKPKGRLNCQLYQRSCDMGLGIPFNIASYALLTHMLAHVCDLVPGTFTHVMGDAHVYADHIDALKIQLEREPRDFPILEFMEEREKEKGEGKIDGWKVEDFVVKGYEPHKGIVMKMSV